MTDISPLMPHADPQLNPIAAFASPSAPSGPSSNHAAAGAPVAAASSAVNGPYAQVDGVAEGEESSIIKCFCGYTDDDGNTVLCEVCNTWQHIECYYPNVDVPEEHFCLDCSRRPQSVDVKAATERQRRLRELQSVDERKARRAPAKSQKKRAANHGKDAASAYTNGWPVDGGRERASGSPKEEPPLKRPKTSHRASGSVSSVNLPRKRAGSTLPAKQSPAVSPPTAGLNGYSGDYFSPEFMQLHRRPSEFSPIASNSYTGLNIPDSLHKWLKDPDALRDATNGKTPAAVFQRIDTPFDELEKTAPGITKHSMEEKSIKVQGLHPIMQWLAIDSAVPPNAYVGELKGRIGLQDEYFRDPSNRWDVLHHPEPFVFFPPHLPIYIDARTEGSQLRYARRSCQPNLRMQIIIADDTNYHFCFISKCEINAGDELTVAWDIDEKARQILHNSVSNGNARKEGIHGADDAYISNWATGVLVNFGGCACTRPQGVCWLERFDRRNNQHWKDASSTTTLKSKGKKGKKGANQASPLSTGHATNSRAGSEAIRDDADEENGDGRSVSGSSKSKPASRDITPMTHVTDGAGGFGNELSGRDRKKLQDVEKLFKQQEYEEQHGRRKKRNSGGSALNTPGAASATTSVSRSDAAHPSRSRGSSAKKQLELPSPTGFPGRSGRVLSNGAPSVKGARGRTARGEYVSMSTQTEPDASLWTPRPVRAAAQTSVSSRRRRLLGVSHRDRQHRVVRDSPTPNHLPSPSSTTVKTSEPSSPTQIKAEPTMKDVDADGDVEMAPPPPLPSESAPAESSSTAAAPPSADVEMPDADEAEAKSADPAATAAPEPTPADPPSIPATAPTEASPQPQAPSGSSDQSADKIAPPPSFSSPEPSPRTVVPPTLPSTLATATTATSPPPPSDPSPPLPTITTSTSTPSPPATTAAAATAATTVDPPANPAPSPNLTLTTPAPILTAPLLSPSTPAAPSPLKKKMSLSDYTNRKKAAAAVVSRPAKSGDAEDKTEGEDRLGDADEKPEDADKAGDADVKEKGEVVTSPETVPETTLEEGVKVEEGAAAAE